MHVVHGTWQMYSSHIVIQENTFKISRSGDKNIQNFSSDERAL